MDSSFMWIWNAEFFERDEFQVKIVEKTDKCDNNAPI
jgi:hypothetical protein